MKSLMACIWVESLKIRRSNIFGLSVFFFLFVSSMMGLLFFVQKHPEIASKLGMIGTKASMLRMGNADWPTYFTLLIQGIAAIGLIGFGFVTSWVFGREYSDHTVKDILALPVSRSRIVLSKFLVIILWCLLLTVIYFAFGLLVGKMVGITGWSGEIIYQYAIQYTVTSLLTLLLCTPVAFFASYGRGYLLPVGFIILTMMVANFTGLVGLGPYFPWAIPGLYSIPPGTEGMQLTAVSYYILFFTSLAGMSGTLAWWRYADQK